MEQTPQQITKHGPVVKRQNYNIDNHRNIIPLNDNLPAFKTAFVAKSEGKFKGVIVDQTGLDTAENLEYRESSTTTEGEWFSGEIEYTDVIPKQFYLILISDIPTVVSVQTTTEQKQPKPKLPPQIPTEPAPIPDSEPVKKSKNTWLIIGIIIVVFAVISGVVLTTGKSTSLGNGGGLPDLDQLLSGL